MSAPDRTREQRMDALQRANDIRTRRSRLKRDIKAGRVTAAHIIATVPWWTESMHTFDLLLAIPKYGRVKANKILAYERVSPSKTIGGLSDRQRSQLLAALGASRPIRSRPAPEPKAPAKYRCLGCKARTRKLSTEQLCGFCVAERAGAVAA